MPDRFDQLFNELQQRKVEEPQAPEDRRARFDRRFDELQQRETTPEPVLTPEDEAVDALQQQDPSLLGLSEQMAEIRRKVNGVYSQQPEAGQSLSQYVDTLRESGINADFALDPKWSTKIRSDAAVNALQFLRDTKVGDVSLLDVQGEGAEEAKSRVLEAFTVASLVRNSPVVGRDARRVHGAAIRQLAQRQMQRVLDQASPGGQISLGPQGAEVTEGRIDEQSQLASLFQVIQRADDDTLFKASMFGAMIDPTDPMSPTDELRQTVPNTLANQPLMRVLFEGISRTGVEAEAARIMEGVNDLGTAPSSKRPLDVTAALAALLGDTWTEQIAGATKEARIGYNLGKLGVGLDGKPGYTNDGVNFVEVLTGDAISHLTTQAAAALGAGSQTLTIPEQTEVKRIIDQDSDAAKIMTDAERLGPLNRAKIGRELISRTAEHTAKMRGRLEALGVEEVDPGLTPLEKEYMGGWNQTFFELADQGQRWFESFAQGLKREDIEVNRQFEAYTGTALDRKLAYALTNNEELAASTDGFFSAWAASGMVNRQNGDTALIGGLRRWFSAAATALGGGVPEGVSLDVVKNNPMFAHLSAEEARRLAEDDLDIERMYASQRDFAKKDREKVMARMLKWDRNDREGREQEQNVLSHWWDTIRMSQHMIGDMFVELGRVASQDPQEAAAMIMLEIPTAAGVGAVTRVARKATGLDRLARMKYLGKVDNALQRLQTHNPVAADRFHSKLDDMVQGAIKRGDPDDLTDALGAAASAAKRAADEAELTGGIVSNPTLRNFGKKIADVWDPLTADPGDIQRFVDHVSGAIRHKGVFGQIVELGRRVFGDPRKGTLRDQVFDQKSFDAAVDALDSMINTGTEIDEMYVAMRDLAEGTGRTIDDLTPDEVRGLMPEQVSDVIAMVDQATKIPVSDTIYDRLVTGLTNLRGAPEAAALEGFKQSVTEAVNMVALRVADSGAQKAGWHGARKRIDRVVRHLSDRREDELANILEDRRRNLAEADDPDTAAALDRHYDALIKEKEGEIEAISDLVRRVQEHDADVAFDGRDLGPMQKLTDRDIEALLTEAPELFDLTPDDLIKYKVVDKGSKVDVDRINTQIANKELQIDRARRDIDQPVTDVPDAPPRFPTPEERATRQAVVRRLEAQLQILRNRANVIKNGRRVVDSVDRRVFFDALSHGGLGEMALARKDALISLRNTVAASQSAELTSNPFLPGHLPIRQAMKWNKALLETIQGQTHSRVARLHNYMGEYHKMTPDEQQAIDKLMARMKGGTLTPAGFFREADDLLRKYPKLRRVFREKGKDLAEFALDVDENMGALLAMMDEAGVQPGVVEAFRKKGYDPQIYGLVERERLLQGRFREGLDVEAPGAEVRQPLLTATGQSLRFQRRVNDYRLLIDEASGVRHEFTFPQERPGRRPRELNQFLRRRYGKAVKWEAGPEDGVSVAKLPTGDTLTLGTPIGKVGQAILDPQGSRAERMLVGLSRAWRDIGAQKLFTAMNMNGRGILSLEQFQKLSLTNKNVRKNYVQIPQNVTLFGNLQGKFVHRRVLADVNAASRAYDSLGSVLRGVSDVLHAPGGTTGVMETILGKTPGGFGRFVDTVNAIMKQNLILLSQRVWLGNQIFNMVLDFASNGGVYSDIKGLKSLGWAIREVWNMQTQTRRGLRASSRNPLLQEMVEGGILEGFFETTGPSLEQSFLARMMDFENVKAMEKKLDSRERTLNNLMQFGTENPGSKKKIVQLQKDILAITTELEDLNRGWLRKIGRNFAAFVTTDQGLGSSLLRTTDPLGRRGGRGQHRAWDFLRNGYNGIDVMHKAATYHNLRVNRGYSKQEALEHVKDFAQNYRDIPQWLRPTGGKGAVLSLVTSFPYEAARLSKNLALKRGSRFAAVMGMIPFMNLAAMMQAGIDVEQYMALVETRGAKTKTDALLDLTNKLYAPNPNNGAIDTSYDLGLVQPVTNLISNDFSPIARVAAQFDREDSERSMLWRIPARFVGNFIGNSPVLGGTVSTVGAIDVGTGEPLWDDKMSAAQKVAAVQKRLVQSIMPAWAPWSRAYNQFEDAVLAPINPRTGRPLNAAKQKGSVVSQLAGFQVKGRGASTAAKVLDPLVPTLWSRDNPGGYDDPAPVDFANSENVLVSMVRRATFGDTADRTRQTQFPIESKDAELRQWILKKRQSGTPEEKEAAEAELNRVIEENYETHWAPLGGTRTMTDRERFLLEEFIKDYTVEAQVQRLQPDKAAELLINMDNIGLFSDRRIADIIENVERTPLKSRKSYRDPGQLRQAVEVFDKYFEENPEANPRLRALRNYYAGEITKARLRHERDVRRRAGEQRRREIRRQGTFRP